MAIRETKALAAFDDEPAIFLMDVIEYQGKMWLVPEWIESPELGYKTPVRIICLENLEHQKFPGKEIEFCLNAPISKAVCEGRYPASAKHGYVVVEKPLGIQIQIPRGIH